VRRARIATFIVTGSAVAWAVAAAARPAAAKVLRNIVSKERGERGERRRRYDKRTG